MTTGHLDLTTYNNMVGNASASTVISSSVFKAFIADVKDKIDSNYDLIQYEEGNFTPSLAFGGGTVGIAYTTRLGRYQRIGSKVLFDIEITLSSKGSSIGSATITGFPFASTPTNVATSPVGIFENLTFAASAVGLSCQIGVSTTVGALIFNRSGVSAVNATDTAFANTTLLRLSGTYVV